MGNATSDGLFGAYMIINITFIVTFRWLLRRKQRLREKKRQSLMRDGGMYGYYSDDDDEDDDDSRGRGYDPGGDLDADGTYLEDRGLLQYVAPSKANKTRTGSEASFDRWVDRVQDVAPASGVGGFDGGLAPVPEGAEDLEAVRGSREDGGDEDMAVFVTTEPVEWRNENQEWEPATILEVKHMSDLKPFYTILLEKDQTEMGTAASCLRRSRDPNRTVGRSLETMSLDRPGSHSSHPHNGYDGGDEDGRSRSYPRPPLGEGRDNHGGQMAVRWADDVSGGEAHSVMSEAISEDYDDDDEHHDPHSNAAVEEWYAERDRRRALKQERLDLLCDDCCGDFAWWEPAAWMGWGLRLFVEALLLPFIGCYLWSFWAERQADRRKAILAERKYGALGSDDESYSSFSSDGEWDSDFDDEGNDEEAVAAAVDTKQSPQDNGAYDPEPIEGTSEYAMKIMGQGGGADAINPSTNKRNSGNRRSSGGNSSGTGGGGGLSAKMAARKAERVADAKRNALNSNHLKKPPDEDGDGASQRLMSERRGRGDEEAGHGGVGSGGGNSVNSSKGGGVGRHYTGRHHSGGSSGGEASTGVRHLDEDLKRLEAEILVWGGDAAARAQQRLSGTSFGRSLQSGWEQGSTRSAANRRDSTPKSRNAGRTEGGASFSDAPPPPNATAATSAAGRRTSSPGSGHRGSATGASSALVAHPAPRSSGGGAGASGGRIASALRGESTRRASNSGQSGARRNSYKAKRGSGNSSGSGRGSNIWTQPPAAGSQNGPNLPRPPRTQQSDKAKAIAAKYPVHLLSQATPGAPSQGRRK